MTELVSDGLKSRRHNALTCFREFASTLFAQDQAGPESRNWQHRRPMQDMGESASVFNVTDWVWCYSINGTLDLCVKQHPIIDIDQIIETNPRQPLLAVTDSASKTNRE